MQNANAAKEMQVRRWYHRSISNVDPWMREILSSKGTGCSAHYVVAHSKEHGAEALSGPGALGSRIQFLALQKFAFASFQNETSSGLVKADNLCCKVISRSAEQGFHRGQDAAAAAPLPTVDIIQRISIGLSRARPYRYVMAKHTRARNHTTYLHVPVFLVKRHACFT